jgi:hypothetical protein
LLLVGGHPAGLWRAQKKSRRLHVSIEPLTPLDRAVRSEIEDEALLLAPFKGCTSAGVQYGDEPAVMYG